MKKHLLCIYGAQPLCSVDGHEAPVPGMSSFAWKLDQWHFLVRAIWKFLTCSLKNIYPLTCFRRLGHNFVATMLRDLWSVLNLLDPMMMSTKCPKGRWHLKFVCSLSCRALNGLLSCCCQVDQYLLCGFLGYCFLYSYILEHLFFLLILHINTALLV